MSPNLRRYTWVAPFVALLLMAAAKPTIVGTAQADRLGGTNGNDVIDAGAGNDSIIAGDGDDRVRGGPGRDTIELGPGNDVLLLGPGDGQDVLAGADDNPQKRDVVQFDKGIEPEDVVLTRQPMYALIIQYGRGDRLQVPRQFEADGTSGYRIDAIRFANGVTWNADVIRRKVLETKTTPQYLVGYEASEKLDGGAGNDAVYGGPGNDVVKGGEGNDRLYGDEGNDTLIGGPGNDILRGELGSDTYVWRPGDGLDTVLNFSRQGDVDVIRFPNHVRAGISIQTKGNDLLLIVNGDPKQGLRISNFNGSATWPIARIEYREGPPTTQAELQALFPVKPQRLSARDRASARLATTSVRPKRDVPPVPVATHRIRTPLESLFSDAPKPDPNSAPASTEDKR